MASGLKLTGDWDKLRMRLDASNFDKLAHRNMRRATQRNAQQVVRAMRKRIKSRRYAANVALTIVLKGQDLPLVDHAAGLFQALTSRMVDTHAALAGVFRTTPAAPGSKLPPYNVGVIVHEGATIPVTKRMRGLFQALSAYSRGDLDASKLTGRAAVLAERVKVGEVRIYPLKATTEALQIPPRPFIRDVAEDAQVIQGCIRQWQDAYQMALRGEAV